MRSSALLVLILCAKCAAMPAKPPRFSVCQGSVCSKHGSPLVLSAAQALACASTEFEVKSGNCMQVCKGKKEERFIATFSSLKKKQAALDACDTGAAAVTIACDAIVSALDIEADSLLLSAVDSKLAGDSALESGDAKAAIDHYSAALDAVPQSIVDAFGAAATAGKETPPPKHTGLPPSRLKLAVTKERERVTPGPQRWIFEAMVGRSTARLDLGGQVDTALADAREATALCPLAPAGWAALMRAGEAAGDAELAAKAAEEMRRREPR